MQIVRDIDMKNMETKEIDIDMKGMETKEIDIDMKDMETKEIRIVLLGKTGCGKSATANSIIGEDLFESMISASSVTKKCSHRIAVRNHHRIVVVDTPGIFDTQASNEETQKEIIKCVSITSPGPHAFILVLNMWRYTEEEHNSIEHFVKYFGENIYKYLIVLFSRRDDLEYEGISFSDHLKSVPEKLKTIINKCGGRVIAFNNRETGVAQNTQVNELLTMILENIEQNDGNYYTDEMYRETEIQIKKQMAKRMPNVQQKEELQRSKELKIEQEKLHEPNVKESDKSEHKPIYIRTDEEIELEEINKMTMIIKELKNNEEQMKELQKIFGRRENCIRNSIRRDVEKEADTFKAILGFLKPLFLNYMNSWFN